MSISFLLNFTQVAISWTLRSKKGKNNNFKCFELGQHENMKDQELYFWHIILALGHIAMWYEMHLWLMWV